jgi:nickel-type superoxide dismutase maturation protease
MGFPVSSWKDKLLLLIGRRRAFRVEGDSMFPTLKHGDMVIVVPLSKPAPGDIVAAAHPFKKDLSVIKRVGSIQSDGRYFLVGDNLSASTDSRSFGSLNKHDIAGKVVCRVDDRFVSAFLARRP